MHAWDAARLPTCVCPSTATGPQRPPLTAPISGLPPAPRPRVSFEPICTLWLPSTGDVWSACTRAHPCNCNGRVGRGGGPRGWRSPGTAPRRDLSLPLGRCPALERPGQEAGGVELAGGGARRAPTHLGIRVGDPELHALHVAVDHVVHGVGAAAADAKDLGESDHAAANTRSFSVQVASPSLTFLQWARYALLMEALACKLCRIVAQRCATPRPHTAPAWPSGPGWKDSSASPRTHTSRHLDDGLAAAGRDAEGGAAGAASGNRARGDSPPARQGALGAAALRPDARHRRALKCHAGFKKKPERGGAGAWCSGRVVFAARRVWIRHNCLLGSCVNACAGCAVPPFFSPGCCCCMRLPCKGFPPQWGTSKTREGCWQGPLEQASQTGPAAPVTLGQRHCNCSA